MLHDTDLPNPAVDDDVVPMPSAHASSFPTASDVYAKAYVEGIAGMASLAGLAGLDGDAELDIGAPVATPRFGRLAMCVAAAGALAIGVMGTVAYGVWFNHDQQAYAAAIAGARQALGSNATAKAMGTAMSATPAAPVMKSASLSTPPSNASAIASAATTRVTSATSAQTLAAPGVPPASMEAEGEQGNRLSSWSGEVARPQATDIAVANAARASETGADANPAGVNANANANLNANTNASASATPSAPDRRQPTPSASARSQRQLASTRTARDARTADSRTTAAERRAADAKHKSLFARVGQFFHRVDYRQHGDANRQDIYSHP
ncbi:hypothetical protein LFL96_33830 [Paraburkholderia sp. D15]|uniref:hypothetical protein n=1 Tax=Paraburkholderia sp. D15 TaxID=2880218 RepID=UPI00247A4B04|nr:hypothetical protein [Paraburkholderia sp. D15]WGS53149.1 hypothetical protein LFL96_33830 [Paraburkholderia sp. D15]